MTYTSIQAIRKEIKTNLINKINIDNYAVQEAQITDLINRAVELGESNSSLLIGPRGAGKTLLINHILRQVEQSKTFKNNAVLVRLHGLVHNDDRLALKSITTQLNLDNTVDGKVFGSFAENLAFLLACLKSGEKSTSRTSIFVLEEFDLFCMHHNQTLLYNLFDVSQSDQAPVCVIGITSRIDVIQLLEKRVKSRFSHRQIFLFPGQDDCTNELNQVLEKMKTYLTIKGDSQDITKVDTNKWNNSIKTLINDKKLKNAIQRLIDIDHNEATLKNMLLRCVLHLSEDCQNLTADIFQTELDDYESDDMVNILKDLSVLELCLVIAMKHHSEIYEGHPMNFEMICTRYVKFANKHSGMQTVQRPVIMKAFEHIQKIELIGMLNPGLSKTQKEYQFFNLLVTPEQISEAISKYSGLPTEVVMWANSSIV